MVQILSRLVENCLSGFASLKLLLKQFLIDIFKEIIPVLYSLYNGKKFKTSLRDSGGGGQHVPGGMPHIV